MPEIAVPRPPDLKAFVLSFFNWGVYLKYFRRIVMHIIRIISRIIKMASNAPKPESIFFSLKITSIEAHKNSIK